MKRVGDWIEINGLLYNCIAKGFVEIPKGVSVRQVIANLEPVSHQPPLPKRPYHQILILEITDRCNYGCVYCFEGLSRFNRQVLDFDKACQAIDLLPCGSEIRFFGGEPLLNFDLVKRLVERYPQHTYSLVTNGSCLDESMATFMADHHFSVGLSYDGKGWHAKNRISLGDAQVEFEKAVTLLVQSGVKVGISSVVTKESIPYLYDLHLEVFSEYGVSSWAYLPAFNTGITSADLNILREQILKIVDDFPADHLLRINDLNSWALKATGEWPLDSFCGAGICLSALTVTGESRICSFFLRGEGCFDATLRAREINCKKCPIWESCYGGCYALNQSGSGDTHRSHPLACKRNNIYFEAGLATAAKKWQNAHQLVDV